MPRKSNKKGHVPGRVLGTGISLLGMGLLLLLVAALLPGESPMLGAVGSGLRLAAPYAVFLGSLLCFVGWLVRPKAPAAKQRRAESEWLPKDSTDFVRSRLH